MLTKSFYSVHMYIAAFFKQKVDPVEIGHVSFP